MDRRGWARSRAAAVFAAWGLVGVALAVVTAESVHVAPASATSPGGTNGQIAYLSQSDGAIHLVRADGTGDTLAFDPAAAGLSIGTTVAGSPDGTRLAFEAHPSAGPAQNDIYVVNVDGTGLRKVTTNTAEEWQPAWSADGSVIFYRLKTSSERFMRVNANGTGATQVATGEHAAPAATPDGALIAFSRRTSGHAATATEIFTVRPSGTGEVQLPPDPAARSTSPTWSPDSQTIAYARTDYATSRTSIWSMTAIGTDQRELIAPGGLANDLFAAWAPDSTELAVARDDGAGATELYLVRADGTGATGTGIHLAAPSLAWLPKVALVTGRVVNGSGAGIAGIHVSSNSPTYVAPPGRDPIPVAETTTAADGTYRLLYTADASDQLVEFSDPNGRVYNREWYDDRPTTAGVTLVSPTLGTTIAGIDATLGPRTDFTEPEITFTEPVINARSIYVVGQAATFTYACDDEPGGSGLRSCDGFMAIPLGDRMASGSPLDTSTLGTPTVNVWSEDWAGNWTGGAVTYRVVAPYPDTDGVDAAIEDAGPNGGDGNGDGTADSQQANVASLPNARDGRYVTMDAAPYTSLQNMQATNPPPPTGLTLPVGLLDLDIQVPEPIFTNVNSSTTLTLRLPAGTHPTKYLAYRSGSWVDISNQVTIAGDLVSSTLVDGGAGDSDGVANGVIALDPGAPAVEITDTTAPTVTISSPTDGASFTVGQTATVSYACADAGGSDLASCVGSVANGSPLDTSTPGTFSLVVDAADGAGNHTHAASSYQVLAGSVSGVVNGPAILTTDPGGLGASPAVPVQTRLQVPAGVSGTVSVQAGPSGAPPAGFVLFGTQVDLSGPNAPGVALPYVATFTVDASQVGAVSPSQVEVFRNGVQVPACTSPIDAVPDPCVADRSPAAGGDVAVTVRTTHFSSWSFGRRAFLVTAVAPGSRAQGTSQQTVVVTGDGFKPGATTKVSGSGVSVASTTRLSDTALQVTLSVGAAAATGARDVIVTNPGPSVATCVGCFTVNARPTVTALTPGSRPAGATHALVQVTGTGLQSGATASFSGTGVTAGSVTFIDATHLNLDVTIDAAAVTGSRSITVTNPDGGTVTKGGALVVNARPSVASLNPANLRRGQATSVVITGSGFAADLAAAGVVSFGPDVSVQSVVRNSASKLTATVAVAAAAVPGPRTVAITNSDGGAASCGGCAAVVVDPQVNAVTPAALARGATAQTVTVMGVGFQPGAAVKISGSGVTIGATTVRDATTLTVDVTVGSSAALGTRDVTVTNPDTGTATCAACFTVNAKPTIGTVTPSSRSRGAVNQAVQISGTGFQGGATIAISGPGVTLTVVGVTPTSIAVEVSIALDAPIGSRNITVTNPDTGTVTKSNGFKVT